MDLREHHLVVESFQFSEQGVNQSECGAVILRFQLPNYHAPRRVRSYFLLKIDGDEGGLQSNETGFETVFQENALFGTGPADVLFQDGHLDVAGIGDGVEEVEQGADF